MVLLRWAITVSYYGGLLRWAIKELGLELDLELGLEVELELELELDLELELSWRRAGDLRRRNSHSAAARPSIVRQSSYIPAVLRSWGRSWSWRWR